DFGAFDTVGFAQATATESGMVYKPDAEAIRFTGGNQVDSSNGVDPDIFVTGSLITLTLQVPGRVAMAFSGTAINSVSGNVTYFSIRIDDSSTAMFGSQGLLFKQEVANHENIVTLSGVSDELSAGPHTFKVYFGNNSGSSTLFGNSAVGWRFSAWTI
ncbi:unnamed protein product, partial [marine sediment metagenome]